jgi:cytochrome c551/c552
MKKEFRTKYMLAYKLNQDALVNLFGQVRNAGSGADHPTPMSPLPKPQIFKIHSFSIKN